MFLRMAFLSSGVYSLFSAPLCLVQTADSYEHHAVPTVASAISSATTGSSHFLAACRSCAFSAVTFSIRPVRSNDVARFIDSNQTLVLRAQVQGMQALQTANR